MELLEVILTTDYLQLAIPFLLLAIVFEILISRAYKLSYYHLGETFSSLGCGMIQQLFLLSVHGAFLLPYALIQKRYGVIDFYSFSIPQRIASAVLLFIAIDVVYYWFHRFAHESNLGWAAHVVHHQSEEYNLSTAMRQSMLQNILSFGFYLPLAVIGFPTGWFISLYALNSVYQFWIHTQLINKLPRWFEAVFNTPSHHRVHHGRNPQYIDRNHAGVFIIWDKLFGTFEPEVEKPVFGITTPVGSYNPLWAQFHYLVLLAKLTLRARRWSDKVRLWWKGPEWLPADLQNWHYSLPVQKNLHKYDSPSFRYLAYLLFGVGLLGTIVVLLTDVFSYGGALLLAVVIAASLAWSGALLTKRP